MKVRELVELLEGTIAELKVAIVANQMRSFESPHTSLEFTQRAVELQEDLDDLMRIRSQLLDVDPDEEVEEHFEREELERVLNFLRLMQKSKSHLY